MWLTMVIESVFKCSGPHSTALLHWQGQFSGRIPPHHLLPPPLSTQPSFSGHFGYWQLQYWLLLRKLVHKEVIKMNDRLFNAMLKELVGKINYTQSTALYDIYIITHKLYNKIKHCIFFPLVTKQDLLTLFINFQFPTKPAQYKFSLVHKTNLSSPYWILMKQWCFWAFNSFHLLCLDNSLAVICYH